MRCLAIAALLLAGSTPSWAQAPQFGPDEKAKLERGEILVKNAEAKGDGIAGKAAGVVRAHPDKVWAVVNDCAHFKDFMPRTVKSEVVEAGQHCKVEIEMPFPFSNLWSETKVQHVHLDGGGRRRVWSLVQGTYTKVDGSWTVWPWGEGATLLLYNIDADPDVPVPNAILRSAQASALPDMFVAVRTRSGEKK